jgi:hypothetical protein
MIVTASLPAAAAADTTSLYRLTVDNKVYFSDGTSWYSFGYTPISTAPVNADFAWINQGTATITQTNGGLFLSSPTSAGANWRIRKKAAPATPYTITAEISLITFDANESAGAGLCFRQSSDGKLVILTIIYLSNLTSLYISKFNDASTWSGGNYLFTGGDLASAAHGKSIFFRIADNGTNRICSYSSNGTDFLVLHTVTRTDFLTADEVGFFGGSGNANANITGMSISSWVQA